MSVVLGRDTEKKINDIVDENIWGIWSNIICEWGETEVGEFVWILEFISLNSDWGIHVSLVKQLHSHGKSKVLFILHTNTINRPIIINQTRERLSQIENQTIFNNRM